ncbi:MAG: HD domain-containing protein [Deltaproteobacteria bacterium]|nr:HD domain-containing protein [Deltaproteobacteria bacterium]
MTSGAEPMYTKRLDRAIALATDAFRTHYRKGSGVPYLTHLFQVMVTVGEYGGDEDQMIAALLHDYLEDIRGATGEDLEERFGARVRRLVEQLSDTTEFPKPPWRERKETYLEELRNEPEELKLISAADKLHNARSILRDLHTIGDELWERFTGKKEGSLWYYGAVVDALGEGWSHAILDELRETVDAVRALAEEE